MKYLWSFCIVLLLTTCNRKTDYNHLTINSLKTEISKYPERAGLVGLLNNRIAEQSIVDSLSQQSERQDSISAFNHILDSINESLYLDKVLTDLSPTQVEENNTNDLEAEGSNISKFNEPALYEFKEGIDTTVFIKGNIKGKAESFIKINQTRLFKKDYQETIVVNEEQDFEETIVVKKAGYYQLQHRQNKYDVFLTPGDTIELLIDHSTDEGLHFLGKTKYANNYLRCAYLQNKAMKYNEYDMLHQKYLSFKKQINYLRQVKLNNLTELLDNNETYVSKAFVDQEKANINYEWARKHLKYQKTNIDNPIATQTSDGKYFNELKFKSSAYFDVYNYRKFLYEYFDFFSHKYIDDTYGKDDKYQYTPEERALKRYNRINFFFKDQQVRDFLKVNLVHDMIEKTKKPLVNPLVAKLKKDVKDEEYIDLINRQYHKHVPMDDGVFAPEFTVKDELGNPLKLKDLKGKWAYIAVWTTWCAPCKIEQPHLEILKKEYANNKNIEILSVSIDEERSKWRKAIKNRAITQPQYIAPGNWNSTFAEAFKLRSVPKYILIDPNGQINDLSTSKPSADIRIKFDHLGI